MSGGRVLLLDSTTLFAYEKDRTRHAQNLILEAIADGYLLSTSALSLAVGCSELGADTAELTFLLYDSEGPLQVLPLALNAVEVGAAAYGAKSLPDLETGAVVHEAHALSAVVLTYEPNRYRGFVLDVHNMRP